MENKNKELKSLLLRTMIGFLSYFLMEKLIPSNNPLFYFIQGTVILLLLAYNQVRGYLKKTWLRIGKSIKPIWNGAKWFFIGNSLLIEDIYAPLKAINKASLLNTFFLENSTAFGREGLETVFSHRKVIGRNDDDVKVLHNILDENYQVPPYPIDEAPFLMRIWHQLTYERYDEEKYLYCSCQVENDENILIKNLILVGSPQYNKTWDMFQNMAIENNWLDYKMSRDETKHYIIEQAYGSSYEQKKFIPSLIDDKLKRDYGMIIRIPNPKNLKSNLFIFAGCHRAGQLAITKWFFNIETMMMLINKYPGSTPFQLILSQKYYDNGEHLSPRLEDEPMIEYEKVLSRI